MSNDRWTYVPFPEAVADQTACGNKLQQRFFQSHGKVPIVDQGAKAVAGYSDDTALAWKQSLPVVIFGDHTRAIKYVDYPFILGADGTKVLVPRNGLTSKFLYYYLRKVNLPSQGYARHFSHLKRIDVPVPPLSEQERIVALLDEADELRKLRAQADLHTADLIPALFQEMFGDTETSRWSSALLGEVVRLESGATPSKGNPTFWNGEIPWVSPKDMKPDEIINTEDHVGADALQETSLRLFAKGTVLIVVRGMILAHTVPIRRCQVAVSINQDIKALIPKQPIEEEYLRWALQAQHSQLLAQVSTAGHGTKRLESDGLRAVKILNPPLSLQQQFTRRVTEIRSMEAEQAKSRKRLDDLFHAALHGAFAGTL